MLQDKKKKKSRGALQPIITHADYSSGAKIETPAPESSVKPPTYYEKGTAGRYRGRSSNRSDRGRTGMGWQERIARNAQLDANYRAALGTSSAESIAASRNTTDIARERMGNRTARAIAGGRDTTLLEGTRMRTQTQRDIRGVMEGGLDRRQKSRQTFLGGEQDKKFEFLEGESEKERASRIQQLREQGAVDLVSDGAFTEPQQVRDYMGDPEFDEYGGLGEVESFNTPAKRSKKYIAPVTKTRTDLKSGVVEPVVVQRGGVFDETTGEYRENPVDEQKVLDNYYDETTGTTKVPTDELTDAELDILIRQLRKKNQK